MSKNVKKHLPVLDFLSKASPKYRERLLKDADRNLLLAICEICYNVCRGNVKCSPKDINKLRRYKKHIECLALTRRTAKRLVKQKRIINQKGGSFLPLLLTPIISSLADYLVRKSFD